MPEGLRGRAGAAEIEERGLGEASAEILGCRVVPKPRPATADTYLTISNYRTLALAEPAYFPPLLSRLTDDPPSTEEASPSPSGAPEEG